MITSINCVQRKDSGWYHITLCMLCLQYQVHMCAHTWPWKLRMLLQRSKPITETPHADHLHPAILAGFYICAGTEGCQHGNAFNPSLFCFHGKWGHWGFLTHWWPSGFRSWVLFFSPLFINSDVSPDNNNASAWTLDEGFPLCAVNSACALDIGLLARPSKSSL